MQVSEARNAASRLNGARSQGPLSPETRAISARNSFKHGLTGKGIVVPEGDQDEIDRRIEALEADMRPMTEAGSILIGQMAILSHRAENASFQESADQAMRVRHAADVFDEGRIDQAETLFAALPDDPRNNLRKLRKSPEGVARLADAWHDLKADLGIDPLPEWTAEHLEQAAHLIGLKSQHAHTSRFGALSRAFWGDFSALTPVDGAGLADEPRKAWAKAALFEAIDAEIAALEEHYLTLDFDTLDLDRAEAGARALFDSSKPATLARRYEAEARRGFFKALKEFRLVEAEADAKAEATPTPQIARPDARSGSSRENPAPQPPDPTRAFPEPRSGENPTVQGPESKPMVFARPPQTPG
jgi:hypothetical protein